MTIKLYVAGPMRGLPNFNFPAFDAAANTLRKAGYEVFSPAERDRAAYGADIEKNPTGDEHAVSNPKCTINDCMAADCEWICRQANGIALLPGWENSKGAKAEVALATALGLVVKPVHIWVSAPEYMAGVVDKNQGKAVTASKPTFLPTDSAARKEYPMASGLLDYFPDALAAVSNVSHIGNKQHNPGQPLQWAREKSTDHDDTIIRHFQERGTMDVDGQRHSAKLAWRALALLQQELERAYGLGLPRGCTVNGKRAACTS